MEDVYHLIGYGINMNDAIQLNFVVVHIQLMAHAESGNEDDLMTSPSRKIRKWQPKKTIPRKMWMSLLWTPLLTIMK
jgi:hypothetical protein